LFKIVETILERSS